MSERAACSETPGVVSTADGGCFVLADEGSESPEVISLDESKKTEGRSTDDAGDFSTEDDLVSLSSTCSSHIAGKWWNGKDTRFLLHCEKKNCGHRRESPALLPVTSLVQTGVPNWATAT